MPTTKRFAAPPPAAAKASPSSAWRWPQTPPCFALAEAAHGATQADRQLAKLYREAGRRAGTHLEPAVRAEIAALLDHLSALQIAYQQALVEASDAIEIREVSYEPFYRGLTPDASR